MSDRVEQELDGRLREIAEEVGRATPRPTDDLLARILAGAADVTAEQHLENGFQAETSKTRWSFNLSSAFPIWSGSAIAVLAVGLIVGIGLGYGFGDTAIAFEAFSSNTSFEGFDDSFLDFGGPI
ncbi:MAG: hypothetical protein AAGC81_09260 [Pseudomonadota bacterium]